MRKPKKDWLRVKITSKDTDNTITSSKITRWRKSLQANDLSRYEHLKKKDADRKRAEYAQLRYQAEEGKGAEAPHARLILKEKNQRQALAQKRYRERKKAIKAAKSQPLESNSSEYPEEKTRKTREKTRKTRERTTTRTRKKQTKHANCY